MKLIYLCGPINGCSDGECNDWRTAAKEYLRHQDGIGVLDPMRRDYRGREAECQNEIVMGDKYDLTQADAVVAMCPKPSVGTSMEILIAWQMSKPVATIVPIGCNPSPWLVYHSAWITTNLEASLDYLVDWVSG